MRLVNRRIVPLLALFLAGCAGLPAYNGELDPTVPSVLFVADPQIHHIYGGRVKQGTEGADLFAGVARRHPETNILAPFALESLVKLGEDTKPIAPFMVVLGDATNAACTAEFDDFVKAVKRGSDKIVLLAHGNHDSYLMGTLNYWQPYDPSSFKFEKFNVALLPPDETWWPDFEIKNNEDVEGWRGLCFQNAASSKPMHKVQWMGKYLKTLEAEIDITAGTEIDAMLSFRARSKPGRALAGLNYEMLGLWKRPHGRDLGGLIETYDSFLVQAVDVGALDRLILIDTSACAYLKRAQLWPRAIWQNHGRHGCMGTAQLTIIGSMVQTAIEAGKRIVLAGHFPLDEISGESGKLLIALMEAKQGKGWTYLSAHTHNEQTRKQLGTLGTEFNISSTTDWPSGAFRVQFGSTMSMFRIAGVETDMQYVAPPAFPTGPELCRHLLAAEYLAAMPVRPEKRYQSPVELEQDARCINDAAGKWTSYEKRLHTALETIRVRMKDEKFREQALQIMSAATKHESKKWSVAKIVGLFVK